MGPFLERIEKKTEDGLSTTGLSIKLSPLPRFIKYPFAQMSGKEILSRPWVRGRLKELEEKGGTDQEYDGKIAFP